MGDAREMRGRCYLTAYFPTYHLLTYYYLLLQAREMLSHNRDETAYLRLQVRH